MNDPNSYPSRRNYIFKIKKCCMMFLEDSNYIFAFLYNSWFFYTSLPQVLQNMFSLLNKLNVFLPISALNMLYLPPKLFHNSFLSCWSLHWPHGSPNYLQHSKCLINVEIIWLLQWYNIYWTICIRTSKLNWTFKNNWYYISFCLSMSRHMTNPILIE